MLPSHLPNFAARADKRRSLGFFPTVQYPQIMVFYHAVITALLAFPALATAATWVEIGGNDAVVVFVDRDSLRRNGTKVKSWLKWQWSKPTEVPDTYPPKLYQLERQLQVSDCANNNLAIAQGVMYSDASGNEVVASYTYQEKTWRFTEVVPETIGESIIKFVCKAT